MKILVAGVGNVFLGDDGFGVAVVKRLADADLPDGVTVADFGIRGIHLAYELTSGAYDSVILVDAVSRHSPPGTLYVLKPLTSDCPASFVDAHDMTPEMVLALAGTLGGETGRVLLVGLRALRHLPRHGAERAGGGHRRHGGRAGPRTDRPADRDDARHGEPGGGTGMLKRLLATAALVGLAVLIYQSIPDIKRYLKIRKM